MTPNDETDAVTSVPDAAYQAPLRKWVEETTAAQGIPVKISDPLTIALVVGIFREGRERQTGGRQA